MAFSLKGVAYITGAASGKILDLPRLAFLKGARRN
jgi:hypothetical protein